RARRGGERRCLTRREDAGGVRRVSDTAQRGGGSPNQALIQLDKALIRLGTDIIELPSDII
ncbi:MAG: hypothetical protein LBK25_07185, partial [Treponema sp.]|nr:hypothetical protein [Treponema sp.]